MIRFEGVSPAAERTPEAHEPVCYSKFCLDNDTSTRCLHYPRIMVTVLLGMMVLVFGTLEKALALMSDKTDKTWENLWKRDDHHAQWSAPDGQVTAIIPRLKLEKVKRVLDLGCGIGRHVILMAQNGFETFGIDLSQAGIERCRRQLAAGSLNAGLTLGEIRALPYEDGFFDFIMAWNVIYHSTRKEMMEVIAEIARVLRAGGLFYLTLMSKKNPFYGKGIEIEPDTFANLEKEDGSHLHHFSDEQDVKALLADWEIERMEDSEQAFSGKVHPESWHWNILARKRWDLEAA